MMPRVYEGDEPYLYVLFAQQDRDQAFRLMAALQEEHFRLWYDAFNATPDNLMQHLMQAEAVLALVTPHFAHSPLCERVVSFATQAYKPIIPIQMMLFGQEWDSHKLLGGELTFALGSQPDIVFGDMESSQQLVNFLMRDRGTACCREDESSFSCALDLSDISIVEGDITECVPMGVESFLDEPPAAPRSMEDARHNQIYCPNCGMPLDVGSRFCHFCGSSLGGSHTAGSPDDTLGFPPMEGSIPSATAPSPRHEVPTAEEHRQMAASEPSGYGAAAYAPGMGTAMAGAAPTDSPHKRKGGLFSKIRDALSHRKDESPEIPSTPPAPPVVPVPPVPPLPPFPPEPPVQSIVPPVLSHMDRPALSDVRFEAIAPERLVRGRYATVDVVMLEDGYEQVVAQVVAEHDEPTRTTGTGWLEVARKTKVRVHLTSPELGDLGSEQGVWNGRYLRFGFSFMVPDSTAAPQAMLIAQVSFDDVPATRLSFVVSCVDANIGEPHRHGFEFTRNDIREAFVSYASQDRARVATIIQGMRIARPDLDIFFDVESLRTGEDWQQTLRSKIEESDVLFLCWSHNASASTWVDFEWRYALDAKGLEFIEPVAIEPPYKCPPPPELNSKHFNDMLLYIIDARD